MSFFLLLIMKEDILKNVGNQKLLQKSMGTINCLVTLILQNIFFYVQQNKEIHRCLEHLEGE